MGRFFSRVASVLLAIGISATAVQSQTAEQAAANRARPYNEGLAAVQRFMAGQRCDGPDVDAARRSIADLDKIEQMSAEAQKLRMPQLAIYGDEARNRRWDLQFKLADGAKSKACYDLADATYRELINVYIGSAFGGIRDRARLGIDDVRDLRVRK